MKNSQKFIFSYSNYVSLFGRTMLLDNYMDAESTSEPQHSDLELEMENVKQTKN